MEEDWLEQMIQRGTMILGDRRRCLRRMTAQCMYMHLLFSGWELLAVTRSRRLVTILKGEFCFLLELRAK